jgi:hypothetical protein
MGMHEKGGKRYEMLAIIILRHLHAYIDGCGGDDPKALFRTIGRVRRADLTPAGERLP